MHFSDVLAVVEQHFEYTPKRFLNSGTENAAGTNAGSCKVFSMGKVLKLSQQATLECFGEHYRDVLKDPDGTSHGNIRAFMKSGWDGVEFPDGIALEGKRPDLQQVLADLLSLPKEKVFSDVLSLVDQHFDYTPKAFSNGGVQSSEGTNTGSCKVLSMGKLLKLPKDVVLHCFAEHYKQVLGDPEGASHGNIRAFMKVGWEGVEFPYGLALALNENPAKRQKTN